MTTRRFEFKKGNSNKYYEIEVQQNEADNVYFVETTWGRIGRVGTSQKRNFHSKKQAETFANQTAVSKIRKGYTEVKKKMPKLIGTIPKLESLPSNWNVFKEELTPGEINIYEKYTDLHTKKRRNLISKKYSELIEFQSADSEINEIRKAAWIFLRYSCLGVLTKLQLYEPAIQELVSASLDILVKELQSLPNNPKKIIDEHLKNITKKSSKQTLHEYEQGVCEMIDKIALEFEVEKTLEAGGISRKRTRILARRLKQNTQIKKGEE